MKNSVENLGIACMKNFPKVRIASDFVEYFLSHKHSLKKKILWWKRDPDQPTV